MTKFAAILAGVMLALPTTLSAEEAVSLRGSRGAMQEQHGIALSEGFDFYRTGSDIMKAVDAGTLVELTGSDHYEVAAFVDYPYLQPEVALFVERLSQQYHEACGQKLVVTSAVRPTRGQPANAHALSVHPAGMAIDLRVSDRSECREWLADASLNLERKGLLNVTREYHPPHFHLAVFPTQYGEYAAERMALEAEIERAEAEREAAAMAALASASAALDQAAPAPKNPDDEGATAILVAAMIVVALPVSVRYFSRRR